MVDVPRLNTLLRRLGEEIAAIRASTQRTDEQLLASPDALPALKYRLVVAIEASIDVADHVIASEGLRPSTSLADAFTSLHESGWLGEELAASLADAARFRNVLVHLYDDVDDRRVLEIARTRLGDLEQYASVIAGRI